MPVEILSSLTRPEPEDARSATSATSAVSPDGRKAPSGIQDGGGQVALRTVCAWCRKEGRETVIAEGLTDAQGRSSDGICQDHADREIARLPKYVVRQEPAGTYRLEDRNGVMIARALPGRGIASAMAVRLEELTKSGEGWCPRHVPTPLLNSRCVSCSLGWESSPWAVNP